MMSTGTFSRANSETWVAWLGAALDVPLDDVWAGPALTAIRSSAHVAEYFVFVWVLDRALARATALTPFSSAAFATALAMLYGLLDELHQIFVPGRSPSPYDWVLDAAGATLAGLLVAARFYTVSSPQGTQAVQPREICS
jgi:hypothetical protein